MSESPWFIDPLTGRRLEKETMSVRVLPRATPKAIERARKAWPQADAGDFDSPPQELDCLGLDPLRFRRRINLDLEALLGGPAVSDVSSRRCFRRRSGPHPVLLAVVLLLPVSERPRCAGVPQYAGMSLEQAQPFSHARTCERPSGRLPQRQPVHRGRRGRGPDWLPPRCPRRRRARTTRDLG